MTLHFKKLLEQVLTLLRRWANWWSCNQLIILYKLKQLYIMPSPDVIKTTSANW